MEKAIIAIAPDDKEDDMPEGVEVPRPEGFDFQKPEEEKDGGMYMCKLKAGAEGKLILMEIDGLPVGDLPEKDTDEPPEDEEKGQGAIGLLGRLMSKARK